MLQPLKSVHGEAGPPAPEELFLQNLALIEHIAARTCRIHCCRGEEAEDFAAQVKIKLVDADYAVLRQFGGKSSLKTYLTTVVINYFHDFRNHLWGRWRPSAEAQRLGEVAIKLEELLWRDGRTFEDACEILRSNLKVDISQRELDEIAARLPQKPQRRLVSDDELYQHPAHMQRPEELVLDRELHTTRLQVSAALEETLAELSEDDQLVIRLWIVKGMKLSQVARSLSLEEKGLYRRKDRILADLRRGLQRRGVSWQQVSDLLHRSEVTWQ